MNESTKTSVLNIMKGKALVKVCFNYAPFNVVKMNRRISRGYSIENLSIYEF